VGYTKKGSKGNRSVKVKKVNASDNDKATATDIERQNGRPAFRVCVRVIVLSTNKKRAGKRARSMMSMFSPVAHANGKQRLVPRHKSFTGSATVKADLAEAMNRHLPREGHTRRIVSGPSNILVDEELGTLARFPDSEDVDGPVSWSRQTSGAGVPAGAADPRLSEATTE
jgi:hypothetical protein